VKTKTFLIGLILMPVLMGGSIVVQILLKDYPDLKDKTFAVIDGSPGQTVSAAIRTALDAYNDQGILDPATAKQVRPRYILDVRPPGDTPETLERERSALEARMRAGELVGFLVVGPDVLQPAPPPTASGPDKDHAVIFETNRMSGVELRTLLDRYINEAVQAERERQRKLTDAQHKEIKEITQPVPVIPRVHFVFVVPGVLMMLMFLVLMMVANPLMQGVLEEKMQRIAEVLLGSVTPFELMLGKLLGMTAVSLTIVIVYLGGGLWAAYYYGLADYLPSAGLLVWFFVFQTLAALMYGSLFTAIGAACTDMKETQNLLLPVMLLCCLPLFVLTNVMRDPNSSVVTGLSFFPFATPMLMVGRMAVPPGVAWWQPLVGMVLVLATTLACVWTAGRIFRVGLLLQGKAPRLGELVRWVLKG